MISGLLLRAAQNRKLENLVSGHPLTKGLVHRYVAGASCEEAIHVARQMASEGIDVSLDLLGEQVEFILDRQGPVILASPRSGHGAKFAPLLGELITDLALGRAEAHPRFALRRDLTRIA